MIENKPMLKDIFDLTVLIDNLKTQLASSYNFETSNKKLKTDINIWNKTGEFDINIQQRYIKFNEDVKTLLTELIVELEDKRDNLTLNILNVKDKDNE